MQTVVHHSGMLISYTEKAEPDWEYFKVSAHKKVSFEPDGLGRAEMVVYVGIFSIRLLRCARLIVQ